MDTGRLILVHTAPYSAVEGGWVDRVVGLEGVRVDIAMLETSDGHGRLDLMKFHTPPARSGDRTAPPNTLGIRRVAFAVDDIDAAVAGLQARGAELLGPPAHPRAQHTCVSEVGRAVRGS
jgi:hypothetical protein